MKFCPNCGSEDIDWVLPQIWSKYECKNCGYVDALIIDDEKIAQQISKEYLKNKK